MLQIQGGVEELFGKRPGICLYACDLYRLMGLKAILQDLIPAGKLMFVDS
jgi:hypothetical protein